MAKGYPATASDDLRLTVASSGDGAQDTVVAGIVELDLEMRRMEHGQATLSELFDLEETQSR